MIARCYCRSSAAVADYRCKICSKSSGFERCDSRSAEGFTDVRVARARAICAFLGCNSL